MHSEMRRKDRRLTDGEALAILERGEYGVLAMTGPDGSPYAIPLSYVLADGALWFHCAAAGQKIDCLRRSPQVCFTVVGRTQPVYDGSFTTYYESAVVHGTAHPVEEEADKATALRLLCEKYLPGSMDHFEGDLARSRKVTHVWKITVDTLDGKAKKQRPI